MSSKHLLLVLSFVFSIILSTSLKAQDFRAAIVNFLYVPEGQADSYLKMEKAFAKPMHKKEIEMGKRQAWEGWWVQMPQGSGQPYSHIAIDMYKDWAQYSDRAHQAELQKAVHPGMSQEKMMDQFVKTVDMVKIEEWRLLDSAVKQE